MSPNSLDERSLPLMEAFYSIQGEGAYSGTPAFFIRLGGCDVGCHWCDVKESWEAEDHPLVSVESIVKSTIQSGAKIAVITGGEPLMYNLEALTAQLTQAGIKCNLETSGAYPLTGDWNWICFSPKRFKQPKTEFLEQSQELKIIVFNRSDLSWAEDYAKKMPVETQLFLQPEWSREKEMLSSIVEYVKQNPKWRISLQTHKYMDIP